MFLTVMHMSQLCNMHRWAQNDIEVSITAWFSHAMPLKDTCYSSFKKTILKFSLYSNYKSGRKLKIYKHICAIFGEIFHNFPTKNIEKLGYSLFK